MKIGVVILNYNTWEATTQLVEALQKQTVASDLEIVVVDNASPNGSYEHLIGLKDQFANVVVVLQTGDNLGYAKGNNCGLQWLDKNVHPDYVVIANNDIQLSDDCLEKLALRFPALDKACIISPVQLLPDGRRLYGWNLGSWWNDVKNLSLLYRWINKRKSTKQVDQQQDDNRDDNLPIPVDLILGSFMFASFERFKEIGFFYPGTFLFVEERFVAYATKQAGCQNYVIPDMTYLHDHSQTINTAFSQVKKYKMQYDGWLKYTRECRKCGWLKAMAMTPLVWLSLGEIWLLHQFKTN